MNGRHRTSAATTKWRSATHCDVRVVSRSLRTSCQTVLISADSLWRPCYSELGLNGVWLGKYSSTIYDVNNKLKSPDELLNGALTDNFISLNQPREVQMQITTPLCYRLFLRRVSTTVTLLRRSIRYNHSQPMPVAARSKAWVCVRSVTGIAGSKHASGMDVCLL